MSTMKALQHETDAKQKKRGKESVAERLRNTGIYYSAAQENEIYRQASNRIPGQFVVKGQ